MNEVQHRIAALEDKGWSLAALADELGAHRNTINAWKGGKAQPRPEKPTLEALDRLLKRARVPKKKRYEPGSRGIG